MTPRHTGIIVYSTPYGDNTPIIQRKELGLDCVRAKRKLTGLEGMVNTDKTIDKIAVYYGLAIRQCCDSVDTIRDSIWATVSL